MPRGRARGQHLRHRGTGLRSPDLWRQEAAVHLQGFKDLGTRECIGPGWHPRRQNKQRWRARLGEPGMLPAYNGPYCTAAAQEFASPRLCSLPWVHKNLRPSQAVPQPQNKLEWKPKHYITPRFQKEREEKVQGRDWGQGWPFAALSPELCQVGFSEPWTQHRGVFKHSREFSNRKRVPTHSNDA